MARQGRKVWGAEARKLFGRHRLSGGKRHCMCLFCGHSLSCARNYHGGGGLASKSHMHGLCGKHAKRCHDREFNTDPYQQEAK